MSNKFMLSTQNPKNGVNADTLKSEKNKLFIFYYFRTLPVHEFDK